MPRRIAIAGHQRIARQRRRPQVVGGVQRQDRRAHPGESFRDFRHFRVIEEVARELAPVLPLAVHAHRQIFAHAKLAPGQAPFPARDDRPYHMPHGQHAQAFQARHPAVPAGADTEQVDTDDLFMVRHQPQRMAAIGMADHVQRRAVGRSEKFDHRVQVQARPVEEAGLETAQGFRCRAADAAVVESQHGVALPRREFGKAAVEALRHAGGAGHQQARLLRTACAIAHRGQRVAVDRAQLQFFRQQQGGGRHMAHVLFSTFSIGIRASMVCTIGAVSPATRACSRPPS